MDRVSALQAVDAAASELSSADREAEARRTILVNAVRQAHIKAGVPQAELARRTGRHRNTIAEWCS